jgi:hypothetical protein
MIVVLLVAGGCSTQKITPPDVATLPVRQAASESQPLHPDACTTYQEGGQATVDEMVETLLTAVDTAIAKMKTEAYFPVDVQSPCTCEQAAHPEELVGTLWLSVPEPKLIEDPLIDGENCAESARSWCDPQFEQRYAACLAAEEHYQEQAAIFPNFVSPVDKGLVLRGMQRGHYGLDIIPSSPRRSGTPIKAVEDGVVVRSSCARGYGYYIVIYHQNGLFSLYSHLRRQVAVEVGQPVQRGDMVAQMGRSGNARGYHLHFELIDLRDRWDLEQGINAFVAKLSEGGCMKKLEFNKFSQLLFNKHCKTDPLPNIPGLAMAKWEHGKLVSAPIELTKAQLKAAIRKQTRRPFGTTRKGLSGRNVSLAKDR